ncbi:Fc receptor-like protein 5 [Lepisosteus oculatus]|uniref:Fc receptor-like protein 5 n=1 Tax=Lepisosteus oculatus TaxID=7918 RepID=UPI0035F4FFB7
MQKTRIHQILFFIFILPEGRSSVMSNYLNVGGKIGEPVILPCAKQKKNSMYGTNRCWYLNNNPVYCWSSPVVSKFGSRLSINGSCNLALKDLEIEDSGLYAYVSSEGYVGQVNLTVTEGTQIPVPSIQGIRGRSVLLPCLSINNGGGTTFEKANCWYHEHRDIHCFSGTSSSFNRFTSRLKDSNDQNMILSELQKTDEGLFTCYHSSLNYGQVKLTVKDVAVSKPVISRNPDMRLIKAGTPITLTCHSENGSWPISYSWYKLNPQTKSYKLFQSSQESLSFHPAEVPSAGNYKCVATNKANGATTAESTTTELIVQSPITNISIQVLPKQLFVFEGQAVVLRCQVRNGSEPISWTWYRIGEVSGEKTIVGHEQELMLTVTTHSGDYACKAQNEYSGKNITLESTTVTVHIVPRAKEYAIATAGLCFSLFILAGAFVIGVWIWKRRSPDSTASQMPPRKDVSMPKKDSAAADNHHSRTPYERQKARENPIKNQYQDVQEGFYCPLSIENQVEEDIYDDLT